MRSDAVPPGMVLEVLGARVAVECDDPVTAGLVNDAFVECLGAPLTSTPGRVDASVHMQGQGAVGQGAGTVTAHVGDADVFARSAGSRAEVLGLVHAAVNAAAVQASPHLLAHAAAVVRDGRVLALPAASGTGKSTLAVALLRRGWTYLSDEALCLPWDRAPAAVPYARPAALSPWSVEALGLSGRGLDAGPERLVRARDAGSDVATAPVPVGAVVLVDRSRGPAATATPVIQDVTRAEVLTELLTRSFNHFRDPAAALERLADVAGTCRVARVRVGAPLPTAAALEAWWDRG